MFAEITGLVRPEQRWLWSIEKFATQLYGDIIRSFITADPMKSFAELYHKLATILQGDYLKTSPVALMGQPRIVLRIYRFCSDR